MKQIAGATQYLHECGLVHSNISSHAVLIRENPFTAKLSSFELTTEILPRAAIGKIYHPKHVTDKQRSLVRTVPAEAALAEKYYKLSKQHFYNRTSLMIFKSAPVESGNEYRLPYSAAYRSMFAMHYYQAPELLIPTIEASVHSVLPSTRSDIFSLGLLLWEALNHCIPFVVYNHEELILAFKQNDAKLPLLDKSSTTFMDIFESCLCYNSDERLSDVFQFITKLEETHRVGDREKTNATIPVPAPSHHYTETKKNIKNARGTDKLPEKPCFIRDDTIEADPQKRSENAITAENLRKLQQNDSSLASVSVDLEARTAPFNQQPEIFNNESILGRIRKTIDDQRVIAPKKPFRKTEESPDTLEASRRSLTDSTMYQSFFDFNRLHTPKVDKDVIYERTSTLKKRMKQSEVQLPKKSIRGLFENPPASQMNDVFNKMDVELSKIVQDYNRNDFMNEIVQELNQRKNIENPSSLLNHGMVDQSRSFEELPSQTEAPVIKRSESDHLGTSYGFSLGDYTLPKTPIARQNKIRRNAWLSDSKKPSGGRISEAILKLNKSGSDLEVTNNSPSNASRKQYNVSIKIHHNDLDKSSRPQKKSNNNSSINIQVPVEAESLPLMKVNNVLSTSNNDLNNSRNVDINKKYYPMMPELLSDVIQNKRDRSGLLQITHHDKNDSDAEVEFRSEKYENVIVPVRTSVRDAVKFIESTFKPEIQELGSPGRRQSSVDVPASPTSADFLKAKMFSPSAHMVQDAGNKPIVNLCLAQASDTVQRPNDVFQTCKARGVSTMDPVSLDKRLETFSYPTQKKITTKVTVNMKKVSRRASDLDHLKKFQDQGRHSICNNAELFKRIQRHFKARDSSLQIAHKHSAISTSCDSLIPEYTEELVQNQGKCAKYFCRNCGFTMLPAEVLQKIQSSGCVYITSSLTENLQSIKCDEGSQSMAALMKCRPVSVRFLTILFYDVTNVDYFRKLNQLRICTSMMIFAKVSIKVWQPTWNFSHSPTCSSHTTSTS